jgi:UDP-N-acetyl-D-galactosamine dehydrogenase
VSITIIGLGYVGLPLAVEFAKQYPVTGYDINSSRIEELRKGTDSTREVENSQLKKVLKEKNNEENGLWLTSKSNEISNSNIYIVTVPTPITEDKRPDLTPLISASETIGKVLNRGDIVIYESTVYPGATEETCIPVLENISGLTFNKDFYAGYSPERINPGDKTNTLVNIKKVTSGSTPQIATEIDNLYNSILKNGTHKASSIKVAEASKVIENAQRDLNISFVNELALIFDRIGIDTNEVIEAAGTKWNFIKYRPGLVGGHCISVDPYYLKWKAEQLGYHPDIISSGRRVNDQMGDFIAGKVVKLMINNDLKIKNSKVLVLGITFKENCPDIRNTKVVDVINSLNEYGCQTDICDPWANHEEVKKKFNLKITNKIEDKNYDAIILAVAHTQFLEQNITKLKHNKTILYDIKGVLDKDIVDGRL